MKLTCERTLLAEAITGVSKAVLTSNNGSPLEGILFHAEGFSLTLTGYNEQLAITTTLEANVQQPGDALLSARLLGDMVRRLNAEDIELSCDDNCTATVKGGITEFNILGMNPASYPPLPSPATDHALDLPAASLKEIVETTLYAVSLDDKKPAHTGELFVIEPEKLTVVALDGFRLAIMEKKVQADKEISVIIPAKTLSEAVKLFGDGDDAVQIAANRRYVVFSNERYTVISRLIEGEFLDYKRVIPDGCRTKVTVDARDFITATERASLIITERLKNPLRITFDGNITVRCETQLGRVVDELDAKVEGDALEIGFNNRYLLDALRNARCDRLVLELGGQLSPVKILPADGGDFLFLVLPVRFKND